MNQYMLKYFTVPALLLRALVFLNGTYLQIIVKDVTIQSMEGQ